MSIDADIATLVEQAVARATRPLRDEVARLRLAIEAPRWMSRRDQAEALSVSIDTIDRMIERDELERRAVGRRVLVRVRPRPTDAEIAALAAEARS